MIATMVYTGTMGLLIASGGSAMAIIVAVWGVCGSFVAAALSTHFDPLAWFVQLSVALLAFNFGLLVAAYGRYVASVSSTP